MIEGKTYWIFVVASFEDERGGSKCRHGKIFTTIVFFHSQLSLPGEMRSLLSHIAKADKSPVRSNVTRLYLSSSLSLSSFVSVSPWRKMFAADSIDESWLRTCWKVETVNSLRSREEALTPSERARRVVVETRVDAARTLHRMRGNV